MEPFYPNDLDLKEKIEAYFAECDLGETVQIVRRGVAVDVKKAVPYTVTDLAVFLGYCSRKSLFDLKQDPAHCNTVKRALARIEGQRVRKALLGEQEPRFAQFDLINNFDYKNTKNVETTITVKMSDDEVKQRMAMLEHKMQAIEGTPDVYVVEGDFQTKLLPQKQG